jgi:polyisoprenoid-binding protein YceI
MKTLFSIALAIVVLLVVSSPSRAADVLKPNLEKSTISFLGKKTGGEHKGGFKKFVINATADHDEPSKSSLKIEIDVASLWADDPKLEAHLKAPDFFDVKKYPKAVFEATKIEKVSDSESNVHGKLTMLGKTAEIVVPVKVEVTEEKIAVTTKFNIDRTKWGMEYGKGMINDEVEITSELIFQP